MNEPLVAQAMHSQILLTLQTLLNPYSKKVRGFFCLSQIIK